MIIKLSEKYKDEYFDLVSLFYQSNAVLHNIPRSYIENTYNELISDSPYTDCFLYLVNNEVVGYMLLSYSYSQEAGGKVVWLEELYVIEEYQDKGIGHELLKYLKEDIGKDYARIRLEVEEDNVRAYKLYNSVGYEELPYLQMIIEKQ